MLIGLDFCMEGATKVYHLGTVPRKIILTLKVFIQKLMLDKGHQSGNDIFFLKIMLFIQSTHLSQTNCQLVKIELPRILPALLKGYLNSKTHPEMFNINFT